MLCLVDRSAGKERAPRSREGPGFEREGMDWDIELYTLSPTYVSDWLHIVGAQQCS